MDISKGGQIFAQLSLQADNLETVRALHHTVISLREALDKSRAELKALRSKVQEQVDINVYCKTIEKLALENHILRQKIFTDEVSKCIGHFENNSAISKCLMNTNHHMEDNNKLNDQGKGCTDINLLEEEEDKKKLVLGEEISKVSTEKLDKRESSIQSEDRDLSLCSEPSQQDDNDQENKPCGDSENESEELDDIELIFTTEETKELGVLQEDLVPITDSDSWQLDGISTKTQLGEDQLQEIPEDALEDSEDPETVKDEKTSSLTKTWTQSVLVETDISKCGVIDEHDPPGRMSRRNTLPAPFTYHPISHREVLLGSKGQVLGTTSFAPRTPTVKFTPASVIGQSTRKGSLDHGKPSVRPILVERNSIKRESEAQTDITALPSQWKSESYLAHKVSHNFTTLPSKFALPFQQPTQGKYSLKLSDKTQEARRTLLSDINFTSMVPELSRSADHLCQEDSEIACPLTTEGLCRNYPRAFSYMKNADMISPGYSHSREKDWSPCSCVQSGSHYGGSQLKSDFYQNTPKYRGSLIAMSSHSSYDVIDQKRRHSWMHQSGVLPQKPSWGSMPSSPTHNRRSRSLAFSSSYGTPRSDASLYSMDYWSSVQDSQHGTSAASISKLMPRNKSRSRVTFQESSLRHSSYPGQSLPDLRSDFEPDSGESTDSLIDEAEEYLRRSIDSMLTRTDYGKVGKRRYAHKYTEGENIQESVPPQSAQPFLPKCPRDLKLDYYVKIITNDSRIMVGRIRYVGNVANRTEPHIGVELPQHSGNSDGSFQGRRYFSCDPDHAVFVPFKKVVMAWSI